MDKYTTKTTINTWFSQIKFENLGKKIKDKIAAHNRYRKKLSFERALELFLIALHQKTESLRGIDSSLLSSQLQKEIGVESFSYSQLSRIIKVLDTEVLAEIFHQLLKEVHQENHQQGRKNKFYLIDSTTFSLNKTRYDWAKFRKTTAGIKLHMKVCHMEKGHTHPEDFVLSNAKEHDHDFLECFVDKPLATYVFDRGYLDFEQLDKMHEEGYFFVTRIKANTGVHQVCKLPITEKGIVNDEIVQLGKQNYLTRNLRLVTIEDEKGKILEFITNRFDVSALEVAKMYHARWQIELFFRHIKQHLPLIKYFSTDEKGVENQIYMAMIAYLLSYLLMLRTKTKKKIFYVVRTIQNMIFEPYTACFHHLRPT